ncbi:MAG: class I SAM-dependent methyltransferase [Treponema sp.]|nr:class I SAM-dependent methyltransferase [Treponema sp.]
MSPLRACKTWSTPVADEERRPVPCALCGGDRFVPSLSCEGFSYVRCAGCGLVQVNPQPVAESVMGRYGDEYLAYEIENEESFLALQRLGLADAGFLGMERELMGRIPGGPRVLDVGCATGALLAFLRGRGWRATGAEISPSAEYARQRRGLDVRRATVEDCAFPAASFDLVLASHLIEHLNRPGEFIREVARILSPGGYFLLTTPNIDGFQARLFGGRWRAAIFDHLYLFSARTLRAMLGDRGFATLGVYTWGGLAVGTAPGPVKRVADRAVKLLGAGDVMLVKARRLG